MRAGFVIFKEDRVMLISYGCYLNMLEVESEEKVRDTVVVDYEWVRWKMLRKVIKW